MSDVKLGCQLSGGIDSSLVTYYANKNSHKGQFESVSIIFSDPAFSEEKYIDKVAGQLNIEAHKFPMHAEFYLDHLEKATWHFEAPINHPNTIGIYLLSQRAKEYVTVLLSGEGADEVFGGYRRYYDVSYPFRSSRFLSEIKNNLAYPHHLFAYFNPAYRSVMSTAYMHPVRAKSLYPSFSFDRATSSRSTLYAQLNGSVFDRQVKYEMHTYLPDLLVRQDKMSMAHSIENRVPFLDNDVVEGSFTIPEKTLLLRKSPEGYNTEKYLLKKLTSGIFGDKFAFREKMGFGIPVRQYFNDQDFKGFLRDAVVPGIRQRGIMDHSNVSEWIDNIPTLKFREVESLWIAITFEIWASIYLDLKNENWDSSD
jgi:asparagine synthase (glutamine-hydrolysing)